MLLWVLAFPVDMQPAVDLPATRPRARIFWRAAYLLIAAVSIASYFISYRHPPLSPPVVSPLAQFPAFVRFVVVWIGSLFSVSAPTTCGGIVLLLFIGLTTAAILQIRRTGRWQPHYPWFLLASYTVISAGLAAIARLGFDYSMAGDSRYTAFSTFFYIALVGLAYTVYAQATPRSLGARMAWPVAIFFLLLILVLWLSTYKTERKFLRADRQLRKHTQLVVRWIDAIPQNPEMAFSYPHPQEKTIDTIRTIAARDGLRPRFVSQALASAVQNPPQAINASAGILEQATLQRGRQVFCKGWARIPEQDRPADCVVLGFETNKNRWRLYCVLETGEDRPDAAGPTGNASLARAGFSRTVDARSLPQTGATMRAWAIDLRNERAFPMAGAISLPAEP
jgi:hypothetical protein